LILLATLRGSARVGWNRVVNRSTILISNIDEYNNTDQCHQPQGADKGMIVRTEEVPPDFFQPTHEYSFNAILPQGCR
jgi:hypothetical protein